MGTVAKRTLTVTADNKTITYGSGVALGSITYSNFAAGEDANALTTGATVTSLRTGLVGAGTYVGNYVAGGAASDNYDFSYVAGNLTVDRKVLTVTAGNYSITYGDSITAGTLSYNGFIAGESASNLLTAPTVSSTQSGLVNAGNYAGNYVAGGGASNNYSFNYVAGNLTVNKKALNVVAANQAITYGATTPGSTLV